ncbi:hypothetical protein WMF30_51870 [Sorangium sp. So ce134]
MWSKVCRWPAAAVRAAASLLLVARLVRSWIAAQRDYGRNVLKIKIIYN